MIDMDNEPKKTDPVEGQKTLFDDKSQEVRRLPDLRKRLTEDVIQRSRMKEEEDAFFARLQRFTSILNSDVEADKLQQHPVAKKAKYLPISFVEMAMDELFFGHWCTENFRWQVVANEVVATMTVRFKHPVSKEWLSRTGAAGYQIMVDTIPEDQKKKMSRQEVNAWANDVMNKKPSALEMGGFASLKADCFKNACLSIGRYFGRDVNRLLTADDYSPFIKDPDERKTEIRRRLSEAVEMCQDPDRVSEVVSFILKAENDGTNTIEFYVAMLEKITGNVSSN